MALSNSDTLDALINQISACQLCRAELPYPPKPIIQVSADAKILIAGQAPGQKAHEQGLPFKDVSGDRLRSWLGVTSSQFYDPNLFAILPMGFCFPGNIIRNGKKAGDKPPIPLCAKSWRQAILSHLDKVELTVILGQYAIDYHLDNDTPDSDKCSKKSSKISVTSAVASWKQYWPSQIVLPHPSPRNNIWLKRHPEFETEILPQLKLRVKSIIS
ncbi:phage SPO1 DNA polymerase domain protein [Shewanella sediminis HAW-EB3]|uniref:Phage SPO1 DNA polymerase domain protein n=1 Tax=Shewanella sediminis (strain HAW-EB3) TaxID=425104 RepID=A8FTF9_SHESH|nr:uracil-DNA glycosylase family protein [Shewanella sediminis]ABV36132.1 phage SPO1 DNA polymerase domain protein [Shewanella sediminis HAW-EB3]